MSFNFLRGISGELELGRISVSAATAFAIASPIGFEVYEVGWNGGHFDPVAWCTAYPAGLAALVAAGLLGIGSKDKSVATAKLTASATPEPGS